MLSLLLALALAPGPDRMVSGTGLRLREAPEASADVVDRAPLGARLSCLEESKPVTVGTTTAPFCKTLTPKGPAWYFTPLTEPMAADAAAQRAHIAERAATALGEPAAFAKERWPDVYEVHALLKSLPGLSAKIAEARFVAGFANAFAGDARVEQDYAQGARLRNDVFEQLLAEAKGKPEHEAAAWALYQHGWGGECEGEPSCVLSRLHGTSCRYLEAFAAGEHAVAAVSDITETANQLRELLVQFPIGDDADAKAVRTGALEQLARVRQCTRAARAGDRAKAGAALDALEKALR